jgi:hypothetical protein
MSYDLIDLILNKLRYNMTIIYRKFPNITSQNKVGIYANPVAWAIVQIFQEFDHPKFSIVDNNNTGIIVISDQCTLDGFDEMLSQVDIGVMSPTKFAGNSPSILAGLWAIENNIHGPSICLTMKPEHAYSAIESIKSYWFRYLAVTKVIMVIHRALALKSHEFYAIVSNDIDNFITDEVKFACRSHRENSSDQQYHNIF